MAQKLIRDIPDEAMERIEVKARMQGTNAEAWIRELIVQVAELPAVRERFAYRVQGVKGRGIIRRLGDDPRSTTATYQDFSEQEADAMSKAENYVRRNQPGDVVKALGILDAAFQEVFEVPV